MMEVLVFGLLGICFGILAGFLPGLGTGTLLSILFVLLLQASPESIIIFYLGILISAQYFGSVTAILTGVPGDPSAIPSATYGFKLAKAGYGPSLLFSTAKYSLWSSLASFLCLAAILYFGWYWATSLSTVFQSVIFLLAVCLLIALSRENALYTNVILCLFGFFLGSVGYSVNFQTYFLVESDSIFKLGIPWVPVMIGLMAIPALTTTIKIKIPVWALGFKSVVAKGMGSVAARGGLIGFLLGTVPGLSYILGSIVAAKVEEYRSNDHAKMVVASESANNAGAISMLLPLFLLGIPITTSEAIVFSLLTSSTSMASIPELILDNWIIISCYFIIINLVFFILAWKCSIILCKVLFANVRILVSVAIIFAIGGTMWLGWHNQQIFPYMIVLAISMIAGLLIKIDWSITIFSMILYSHIETNIYKVFQLYF